MPSTHGGHCPFPYAVIISVLNFLHHSRTVLEADLVSNSHLSGGSIAHAVEKLVKHINLILTQRIFKRYTELVELVRKLRGVDFTLSVIVYRINHLYLSFRFYRNKYNQKVRLFVYTDSRTIIFIITFSYPNKK